MNLWLVFAETLENAEPSEDFRGRIVRIAELSRKVLTFPKNSAVRERSSVPISTLVVICALTCVLLAATWYSARAWTRIDRPTSTADIESLAEQLASNKLKLDQEMDLRQKAEKALGRSGQASVEKAKKDEDAALKAQAEAEHFKQQADSTSTLLSTLAHNGARLIPMKATEAAEKGVGYAIFAQKSGLVFVGSNLPKPSIPTHTFQLWILRGEAPEEVSAGFMPTETTGTWILHYEDASMLTGMTGLLVTEEPIQGNNEKPSGPKLFEASTAVEQD